MSFGFCWVFYLQGCHQLEQEQRRSRNKVEQSGAAAEESSAATVVVVAAPKLQQAAGVTSLLITELQALGVSVYSSSSLFAPPDPTISLSTTSFELL